MDMTPESIRAVQFREKLRGYHPDDVDAFVAEVAKGLEDLAARSREAEVALAELETRAAGATDAEDSLRRTLVLAQRTADLAIQEARAEAAQLAAETAESRRRAEAEAAELRDRLRADIEAEERELRDHLFAQRAALQRDVDALHDHLARERERLRIYFNDQLRRVDQGDPSIAPAPEPEGPPDPEPVVVGDDGLDPAAVDEFSAGAADGPRVYDDDAHDDSVDAGDAADHVDDPHTVDDGHTDDDAFLAELRRAVTDDEPLGPRDHEPTTSGGADDTDDDGFDLFARSDDDAGRFGSRLRRRR